MPTALGSRIPLASRTSTLAVAEYLNLRGSCSECLFLPPRRREGSSEQLPHGRPRQSPTGAPGERDERKLEG
ncbi:hypothetical protein DPM13_12825 [Paracoccus mutanolyticus]|uniref:Uncharacterized protein n=1 Tax=Paracoccus mutanolyticus TaxID=1499308 RepID=A0ABM6WSR3_9RHOB|nr:hypothetical protein DPM13_12825 [Paracoccus mutanolyticus]